MMLDDYQAAFLTRHALPPAYADVATQWFLPLADAVAHRQRDATHTRVIGIHGCQGSGKTTLADWLAGYWQDVKGLRVASVSIDDFYLTRDERADLAESVHPLFRTRGVPGTHDITLANRVIDGLCQTHEEPVYIPRFDKAQDDRRPESEWEAVSPPIDCVLLEGWCLGVPPQSAEDLVDPVNTLEATEDPDAVWRNHVNQSLATVYPSLFRRVDEWVMLQAPSFDCVYRWRLEQEQKLATASPTGKQVMNQAQIQRFIQHYQRLTEHALKTLPARVQHLYVLGQKREILSYVQPLAIPDSHG